MKRLNPLVSDDSVNAILGIASAFQKSKALLCACELEIFTVLGDEPKTSKEIAYETETDERAIDRLLNALCNMHLLEKSGNQFSNTKGTRRFLVKGSPEYLGKMMHITHYWDIWSSLTDAIRKGTATNFQELNEKDDEWVESFIFSMHSRAAMQAPDIISKISLENVEKMIDLGCGSGLYAIDFVRAKPGIKAIAFDLPKVIPHTKTLLAREGFSGIIETKEGDFITDDIGSGYDLVFISSIMHMFSLWENVKLLQKIYDSLNKGGKVVIQDFIIDDNRIGPEEPVFLSLNMLVNTKAGDSFTGTDFWIMLKEAWFKNITIEPTEFGTSLIIATK